MPQRAVRTAIYGAAYFRLLLRHFSSDETDETEFRRFPPTITRGALLIHGWGGTRTVMHPLRTQLERRGIPTFTFHGGISSLLPHAVMKRELHAWIASVLRAFPRLQPLVIGHSQGGLLAKDVIDEGAIAGRGGRLITLGSPFRGTWPALMACAFSFSAVQLLPINPRYWRPTYGNLCSSVPIMTVAGRDDFLARPSSCEHPAARKNIVLPTNHVGLIGMDLHVRHRLLDEIVAFVDAA